MYHNHYDFLKIPNTLNMLILNTLMVLKYILGLKLVYLKVNYFFSAEHTSKCYYFKTFLSTEIFIPIQTYPKNMQCKLTMKPNQNSEILVL